MTHQKFAEILLSRFLAANDQGQYAVITTLIHAEGELNEQLRKHLETDRVEDLPDFVEWAVNLKEILFLESIGELKDLRTGEPLF